MEIIRDWKQIKSIVDPNYTYCCTGFTRNVNLFSIIHENIYNRSLNRAQRMFGTVWDNYYDCEIFLGRSKSASEYDDNKVVKWFSERNYDYLFIPDISFIHELIEEPLFKEIRKEVDKIWEEEKYEKFLCNWNPVNNAGWIKLLFSRHYRFFSNRCKDRLVNRIYQTLGPDGSWGFIYKHFWEKYCGGTYEIVPLLRNKDNLPIDHIVTSYPPEVTSIFKNVVTEFEEFKLHKDVDKLTNILKDSISKSQDYEFESLITLCEEITSYRYIILFSIKHKPTNSLFRLWEYDNNI